MLKYATKSNHVKNSRVIAERDGLMFGIIGATGRSEIRYKVNFFSLQNQIEIALYKNYATRLYQQGRVANHH